MLASKKEKELLKFWQNASIGEILGFDKEYIRKKINKEYDLDFFKLGIKNALKIIKTRGIEMHQLEQVLDTYLDTNQLLKSSIDFGVCTIRLNDFKPLYIFKKDMHPDKIKDYILASCYLPLFKMEKKVDDHYYLDGGFYDNTPINMLIEKGMKKIYVVELNPLININRKPKKEVEMIRITPTRNLGGVLIYDSKNINDNIKMGYYDTLKTLKKLDGFAYYFKRRPSFYYNRLVHQIDRKELFRLKGFFHSKTNKEVVLKALEYYLQRKDKKIYQVYRPEKVIKEIKKEHNLTHFVWKFITQLKFL